MHSPNSAGIAAAFIDHGGNIAEARRQFPDAPEPWIDLSTGISPWPYPLGALSSNAWSRLPEPEGLNQLSDAARHAYGATSARYVVPCPGTDIAIGLLPRVVPEKRDVAIVSPTYAMHEKSWRSAGFRVRRVSELGEIVEGDIGVVVNPNNPDGRIWQSDIIEAAARRAARGGGLLIVDEAFADAAPGSSALHINQPLANVVVLRSFGKFYGLGGLRLGFLITDNPIGQSMKDTVGSWSVSGPAIAIGTAALRDDNWKREAIAKLEAASERLRNVLVDSRLDVVGGTAHFQLAKTSDVTGLFAHLAHNGILTRPLPQISAIRFGVPENETALERLKSALASYPRRP